MKERPSEWKPNVLILLFDALSARHMSLHGYHRETTPNLARFAEKATVYHRHYATGSFTPPGTASILTGTYPWSHRAFHFDAEVTSQYRHRNLFGLVGDSYCRIAYPHNTLAHLLLNGFREDIDIYLPPEQFGLVGGTLPSQLFPRDANIAFRSFENLLFRDWRLPASLFFAFADRLRLLAVERFGQKELVEHYPRGVPTLVQHKWFFLLEHVIDGIAAVMSRSPQPFLAYCHLFPPHEPYRPHRDFVGRFDDGWTPVAKKPHALSPGHSQESLNQWRVEYDEYVAFVDAEFGRLYDFLVESGLIESSYVIITSDHGQLFERGVHGHITELLYEPVIHTPLLISRPGQEHRADVHAPTSSVDLLPTLLRAIGQGAPEWCEGKVLVAPSAQEATVGRTVFALDAKANPVHRPLTKGTVAMIGDQYKLIHYLGYPGYDGEYELFDLKNDPEEQRNLYPTERVIAADMQHELERKLGEVNEPFLP
jgi:arylsulfatase A-like enzyme